ncbi:MAG TPA: OsmC family protein [Phaeodactylibacter sp.]|nr:OsmC family protein [Phaeodactylibacter sp.]
MRSKKVQFKNTNGYILSARLELPPDSHPYAFAIFAHVFTGNKNLSASRHISRSLTQYGIGVLRFDFTGLGESEGNFADTNFTSNVEDLLAAADFLEKNYAAPRILIGHSLGGAAVIFAASQLDSIQAVATVGAPSEPEHVAHLLQDKIEDIEEKGVANVSIGGRNFTIKKQFLDDLYSKDMFKILQNLKKPILVLHSPQDTIVTIENAAKIYHASFHPKSFVSLDGADHMLTKKIDAAYVGDLVASWMTRYVAPPKKEKLKTDALVAVRLGDIGFTAEIQAGQHGLLADESEDVGGDDFGPSPYQYLSAALGACTVMTLQMYARRKKWDLKEVKVHIDYAKRYVDDCKECVEFSKEVKIDHFEREIELVGNLTDEQKNRLLEIADRCPVHRTLSSEVRIITNLIS